MGLTDDLFSAEKRASACEGEVQLMQLRILHFCGELSPLFASITS